MKFFATILLLLAFIKGQTQNNKYISGDLAFGAEVVTAKQIPKEIKYDNNIQFALKWNDKKGENYFIVTISDKEINETTPTGSDTTELWEMYTYKEYFYGIDKMRGAKPLLLNSDWRGLSCKSGVLLSIIKNSVSVTDIDKDSIAEVTVASRWRCKNDSIPTYTNIFLKVFEFEDMYSLEGMGLERKTKTKKLTSKNICCIDSTTRYIHVDSTDSPKAQGLIKNFLDFKSTKTIDFDENKDKEQTAVFLGYSKKTWINIIKKEFEEYQEIKNQ